MTFSEDRDWAIAGAALYGVLLAMTEHRMLATALGAVVLSTARYDRFKIDERGWGERPAHLEHGEDGDD